MTDIDWSKAPEGYPIWITDNDNVMPSQWHREEDNRFVDIDGGYWQKTAHDYTVHRRQQPTAWSGAGLPPVGTVCEVEGETVVVVAHHCNGTQAIYAESITEGLLYYGDPGEFRPIRTPEQIAADDREAAVAGAFSALISDGFVIPSDHADYLYALYDSGHLRKP
jgi:hypothetical protein